VHDTALLDMDEAKGSFRGLAPARRDFWTTSRVVNTALSSRVCFFLYRFEARLELVDRLEIPHRQHAESE
jgi:hypothetical protein